MTQELDQKIQEVYKHIQTERKILQASKSLAQATTNQDVLRRNEAKIRETERTLSYFEETLRELQARKLQGVIHHDQVIQVRRRSRPKTTAPRTLRKAGTHMASQDRSRERTPIST
ncbi:hypothetical protein PTI98_010707 [Pleurotus ostreatus]|nr:hypothetical protein PTI98_010707 [Pleurotus ostreatus]